MNFIRTFFQKPLRDIRRNEPEEIYAIDFTKIVSLGSWGKNWKPGERLLVLMQDGTTMLFEYESRVAFMEAFEEYARAMFSAERGPVGFLKTPIQPSGAPQPQPVKTTT